MPVSHKRKKSGVSKTETFVPDPKEVNRWEWYGYSTQAVVIIAFGLRFLAYGHHFSLWQDAVWWIGIAIGISSQIYIYFPRFKKRRLLTGYLFRFTRHPMYTGLFIADIALWFRPHLSLLFVSSASFLYTLAIFTAWFHEQEVMAKFGPEAEAYYARTPRLFFLYPFMRL